MTVLKSSSSKYRVSVLHHRRRDLGRSGGDGRGLSSLMANRHRAKHKVHKFCFTVQKPTSRSISTNTPSSSTRPGNSARDSVRVEFTFVAPAPAPAPHIKDVNITVIWGDEKVELSCLDLVASTTPEASNGSGGVRSKVKSMLKPILQRIDRWCNAIGDRISRSMAFLRAKSDGTLKFLHDIRIPSVNFGFRARGWKRLAAGAGMMGFSSTVLLVTNYALAELSVPSQQSALLTSLASQQSSRIAAVSLSPYPSYLHAGSPLTILGLPPAMTETFVPPLSTVDAAWKQFKSKYHPDKSKLSPEQAYAVWTLGNNAYDDLAEYWKFPFCKEVMANMLNPKRHTDPSLPHFSIDASARCSLGSALSAVAVRAATPFWKHTGPLSPKTVDDLARYTPCSLRSSLRLLDHQLRNLPPPLARYWMHPELVVARGGEDWLMSQVPANTIFSSRLHRSWDPFLVVLRWAASRRLDLVPELVPVHSRETWIKEGLAIPDDFKEPVNTCFYRGKTRYRSPESIRDEEEMLEMIQEWEEEEEERRLRRVMNDEQEGTSEHD